MTNQTVRRDAGAGREDHEAVHPVARAAGHGAAAACGAQEQQGAVVHAQGRQRLQAQVHLLRRRQHRLRPPLHQHRLEGRHQRYLHEPSQSPPGDVEGGFDLGLVLMDCTFLLSPHSG